jgi:hypothetical protein
MKLSYKSLTLLSVMLTCCFTASLDATISKDKGQRPRDQQSHQHNHNRFTPALIAKRNRSQQRTKHNHPERPSQKFLTKIEAIERLKKEKKQLIKEKKQLAAENKKLFTKVIKHYQEQGDLTRALNIAHKKRMLKRYVRGFGLRFISYSHDIQKSNKEYRTAQGKLNFWSRDKNWKTITYHQRIKQTQEERNKKQNSQKIVELKIKSKK